MTDPELCETIRSAMHNVPALGGARTIEEQAVVELVGVIAAMLRGIDAKRELGRVGTEELKPTHAETRARSILRESGRGRDVTQ